jgi:hypothetical protein
LIASLAVSKAKGNQEHTVTQKQDGKYAIEFLQAQERENFSEAVVVFKPSFHVWTNSAANVRM